ncbi:MAG: Fimbrial assembly family protein [Rickettsiaceae bacterium]|jgi:type IV pilus assembly protein PilN|nr:Fimbrial assembly family protein [Rickettsiaceae bacterium]
MHLIEELKNQVYIHRNKHFKRLKRIGLRKSNPVITTHYEITTPAKIINITPTEKRLENFLKSTSEKLIDCYDKSVDFFSLHNLRHEELIGVDITPNCIYLCKIDGHNGKRVLTSLTSVCMEGKFMTEDIRNNLDEYADSLKSLVKENNIKSKNVALSIPVSNSTVRTVTLPRMDDAEIKKALKFGSLWNNLMQPSQNPEDYSVFYQVIRRDKSEETMDVLFVAAKLSDVSLYTDIIKRSGLNPVIVDVRCFAINNAFNHKLNAPSGPCVFLKFGFEENYALITDGDKADVFQIDITESDRTALINLAMNEETFDSFTRSYAKHVRNIILGYECKYNTIPIINLCVLSSIPLTNKITDRLALILDGFNISHCNLFSCMDIKDDFTISTQSAKQTISSWAACIGAAFRKADIFGTSAVQYNTNFLANAGEYEKGKRLNYIISTAAAFASLILFYFVTVTQINTHLEAKALSMQLATLQGVEKRYYKDMEYHHNLSIATNSIDDIDNLIDSVGNNQRKLLAIHQYLAEIMVENVWLKEMTFTAPNRIEIHAASTKDSDILEFIDLLNGGNQFEQVALKGMQEVHEMSMNDPYASTVKNFKLQGLITNTPILDPNKIHIMAGELNPGT